MNATNIYNKAKQVAKGFVHLKFNKYAIVLALGVLLVGFLGDNSVVAHLSYKSRISDLKAEIAEHKALTQANLTQIRQMENDPKAVERVAREQYFMRAADEDVFVLSDDVKTPPTNATDHATVE